jgi:hypothetical protein
MTFTSPSVFPEFVQGSSYLESAVSIDLRLHNATNHLDLKLPQNTLQVLAPGQASRSIPVLFNGPAGLSVRTGKTFSATKRTGVRSHIQPHVWKTGGGSAYARGVPTAPPVSQLAEVPKFQPPPAKARARRAKGATKSKVSQQPAITTPSRGGKQGASQTNFGQVSATQTAAPQVEAALFPAHTGPSAAAVPPAASWGAGEETTPRSTLKPLSWETDSAAEISQRCGLDGLPLELIDRVLPRLRAFLRASESSTSTDARKTNTDQVQAPNASALQTAPSSGMEESELLATMQLLAEFRPPTQPTASLSAEDPGLESLSARLLSPEELDLLLWGQGSAVAEPSMEDSSAVMEYLRHLEHSQEIEGGQREFPMALPTYDDAERTTSFGEHMDMGAFADLDYGQLVDGWEGWAEFGCIVGM